MTLREVIKSIDLVTEYKGRSKKELNKRIYDVIQGFWSLGMWKSGDDIYDLWKGKELDFDWDGTVVEYLEMIADTYYEGEALYGAEAVYGVESV